jgi:hypothetical protein
VTVTTTSLADTTRTRTATIKTVIIDTTVMSENVTRKSTVVITSTGDDPRNRLRPQTIPDRIVDETTKASIDTVTVDMIAIRKRK